MQSRMYRLVIVLACIMGLEIKFSMDEQTYNHLPAVT